MISNPVEDEYFERELSEAGCNKEKIIELENIFIKICKEQYAEFEKEIQGNYSTLISFLEVGKEEYVEVDFHKIGSMYSFEMKNFDEYYSKQISPKINVEGYNDILLKYKKHHEISTDDDETLFLQRLLLLLLRYILSRIILL
jgi:hypothetical protein